MTSDQTLKRYQIFIDGEWTVLSGGDWFEASLAAARGALKGEEV